MNVSLDEQECIQEAFQYYDKLGDNKLGIAQVCRRELHIASDARVSIEEFIPIYGALKKVQTPGDHDRMHSCLSNFDRDQEGYIQQADLRHILENLEFVNGRARIPDVVDLIMGKP